MYIIEQKDIILIRNCFNAITAVSINCASFPFFSITLVTNKINKPLLPRNNKINLTKPIHLTFTKPIICVRRSLWEVPDFKTNQKLHSFTFKNVREILFL